MAYQPSNLAGLFHLFRLDIFPSMQNFISYAVYNIYLTQNRLVVHTTYLVKLNSGHLKTKPIQQRLVARESSLLRYAFYNVLCDFFIVKHPVECWLKNH